MTTSVGRWLGIAVVLAVIVGVALGYGLFNAF
jgi:hypothetical protein